jgi:outer membrane protein assembly factor BamB
VTELNRPDVVQLLVAAMHQEAEIAMSLTDTPQQLERFQVETARRRRRARVLAVAAAAAVTAGAIYAGTSLGSAAKHHGQAPITHKGLGVTTVALPPLPTALPPAQYTALRGPDGIGTVALGSLWAQRQVGDTKMRLYRVTPDATRIESTLNYDVPASDLFPPPFQVGNFLAVPAVSHGRGTYLLVNAQGRLVRRLTVADARGGVGDASGGWAISGPTSVVHLDASARITRTYHVNGVDLSAIAQGGGSVWLWDSTVDALMRLDPTTGKVTGQHTFPIEQWSGMTYLNGAVYVATDSYALYRLDARSLKITAKEYEDISHQWAWQDVVTGTDGTLWTTTGTDAVAQLDPETLHPIRYISPQPSRLDFHGGGSGQIVITADHIYVADVFNKIIYAIDR